MAAPPRKSKVPDTPLDPEYFRFASIIWYILVIAGLTLFYLVTFKPDSFPFEAFGLLGKRLQTVKENNQQTFEIGFTMAILVHIAEACMAFRTCRKMNLSSSASLKWTLQTLLLGFPSFGLLLRYKTDMEVKEKLS
ncbi:predicted protein [Nematostella vectensis]|uniref:Transmembrane protein 254 n=1 Tax=Nematostella vectensis TaxID=45351 RepID=A7RYN1_NEMVE|nr:transmembrane protein 254 [Nematostella vectensis]EDO43551.1 predicted protein [Nematostella vectensis]|eukprot:XP_001635614.1 predicted protein [Nematostella vectensis]